MVLYILRDCDVARNLWMSIDSSLAYGNFFHMPLHQWMEGNIITKTRRSNGVSWPLFFATVCSFLWQSRNLSTFFEGETVTVNDLYHRVIRLAREYGYALEAMGNASK